MRRLAYPLLLSSVAIAAPVPSLAQDEEGGSMIERFLQDTLSGDDQNVRVIGLQGALSSRATIQEITVADDEGIWLTIKNAELDWNRLALIRGAVFRQHTVRAGNRYRPGTRHHNQR